MQVEIVQEFDETLAQIAADLEMTKEQAASLILQSALAMESTRS